MSYVMSCLGFVVSSVYLSQVCYITLNLIWALCILNHTHILRKKQHGKDKILKHQKEHENVNFDIKKAMCLKICHQQ